MKVKGWILWLLLTPLDSILWAVFHKVVCLPTVEAIKCSFSAFTKMISAIGFACRDSINTSRPLLDSSIFRNLTFPI